MLLCDFGLCDNKEVHKVKGYYWNYIILQYYIIYLQ